MIRHNLIRDTVAGLAVLVYSLQANILQINYLPAKEVALRIKAAWDGPFGAVKLLERPSWFVAEAFRIAIAFLRRLSIFLRLQQRLRHSLLLFHSHLLMLQMSCNGPQAKRPVTETKLSNAKLCMTQQAVLITALAAVEREDANDQDLNHHVMQFSLIVLGAASAIFAQRRWRHSRGNLRWILTLERESMLKSQNRLQQLPICSSVRLSTVAML